MTEVVGLLAAGASSRMRGRDKLLEDVGGESLLARQVRLACSTGVPVLVALPPDRAERRRLVEAGGARALVVEDAADGMGASISALACEVERMGAVRLLIVLADMPDLEAADLLALLETARGSPDAVVRAASADGRPGHPVVFPAAAYPALQRLDGDRGARHVISAWPNVVLVPLPDSRALVDLDTPEEWDNWRASRPR